MTYTDEFPKVSGWYWLKKPGRKGKVVEVLLFSSALGREWCRIDDMTVRMAYKLKGNGWKWAGPLEEPEKATCAAAN